MGKPLTQNESPVSSLPQSGTTRSLTQSMQFDFAGHIRNPATRKRPANISERRMSIYRDLFYNNIEGFIANGFPVLRSILSDNEWHAMIREFMVLHRCKTPYFPEISEEFLEYLQLERPENESDRPFMIELAHYEWVELALDISTLEVPIDPFQNTSEKNSEAKRPAIDQRLLDSTLSLSPVAWNLTYQWPVHHLSASFQPETEPDNPTYLLVYRNRADTVKFIEMNPVTARLVSLIKEHQPTGQNLIEQLQEDLKSVSEPQVIYQGGLDTLFHLYEVDALILSH